MSKEKHVLGSEPIYDARTLGLPKMLILGLQHMFAMFGATVLVPILVSNNYGMPLSIQTTLFFAGIGTLIFHICSKLKIPAFLGSSFAFLGGFQAVSELNVGKFADMTGAEKLPYAMGGIVIAGLMYILVALLFKVVGVQKVMRFFPPIVTGPMIILPLASSPRTVTSFTGLPSSARFSQILRHTPPRDVCSVPGLESRSSTRLSLLP